MSDQAYMVRLEEARRARELSTESLRRAKRRRAQWDLRRVDLQGLRRENNFAARIAAAYGARR